MSPQAETQRRWRRRARGLRLAHAAGVAAFACALAPAGARAQVTPSAQAAADGGEFLAFAPAPAQPAGLCLVDTGVNVNPDTQGEVVDRTALDGGSGDDASPTTHGSVMAMMAAASVNAWGMVGTAPGAIRIVSVRILAPGQTTFPFAYYAAAIDVCLQLQQQYNIRVINLSLGGAVAPSSGDVAAIADAVGEASNYGVSVVAAAGNDDGGPLEYPAADPAVLAVGATDTQGGAFCTFSNRGVGLRLAAPGCDLSGADPNTGATNYNYWQGSSEASAIAAAALTALRAYRPDLSVAAAQSYLSGASGGALDIAQAFRNAGLAQIVAAGQAAEPAASSTPSSSGPTPNAGSGGLMLARFERPRAHLARVRGALILSLSGRPRGARVEVRVLGHRGGSRRLVLLRTQSGTFAELRLRAGGVVEVSVRYSDPHDASRTSPWRTVTVPRTPSPRHTKRGSARP